MSDAWSPNPEPGRTDPLPEPGPAGHVVDALRTVYDPCCREKGISVVDMGLVRSVTVDDGRASIQLLLTTGWCPFAARLLTAVTERAEALPGISDAHVEVVWDQAWTLDRLSDDARAKLRFLPDPSAVPDRDGFLAARLDQPRRNGGESQRAATISKGARS